MHTLLPIEITLPIVSTAEERIADCVAALTANGFYADETEADTVWFDQDHTAGLIITEANTYYVGPHAIRTTPDGRTVRGMNGTKDTDGKFTEKKGILRIHRSTSEKTCSVEFDFRNSYYPSCYWAILFSQDEKGNIIVLYDDVTYTEHARTLLSSVRSGVGFSLYNGGNQNNLLDYSLLRMPSPENQCAMEELYMIYTQPAAYMNQIVRIGEKNYRFITMKKQSDTYSGGFAFPVSDK